MTVFSVFDLADELRDAVGDMYDGISNDNSISWHEDGLPDAIDWHGVAETLLRYFDIKRR